MGILEERTKEVIQELQSQCTIKKWKLQEIKKIVNTILETEAIVARQATPIVKIAKHYDIGVYNKRLKAGISSAIILNGDYGKEKVILINKNEKLCWKRYFVAVELGEYILDFLSNENYQSDSLYLHQYEYKNHNDSAESERFAIEILMPERSFLRQYVIATSTFNNQIFTIRYLSRFFELPEVLIRARIKTILKDES